MVSDVKVQVFTDFDGTLSLDGKSSIHQSIGTLYWLKLLLFNIDTGLMLIDDHRSLGPERRRELEHLILTDKITYR